MVYQSHHHTTFVPDGTTQHNTTQHNTTPSFRQSKLNLETCLVPAGTPYSALPFLPMTAIASCHGLAHFVPAGTCGNVLTKSKHNGKNQYLSRMGQNNLGHDKMKSQSWYINHITTPHLSRMGQYKLGHDKMKIAVVV